MFHENGEITYAECYFCGEERNCFIHHELGEGQAVCSDCLQIEGYE